MTTTYSQQPDLSMPRFEQSQDRNAPTFPMPQTDDSERLMTRRNLLGMAVLSCAGYLTYWLKREAQPPAIEPAALPVSILAWRKARRLFGAATEQERYFEAAAQEGLRLSARYYAGGNPGGVRSLTPVCVYRVEGYREIYLDAFCYRHSALRTFKLADLEILPSEA